MKGTCILFENFTATMLRQPMLCPYPWIQSELPAAVSTMTLWVRLIRRRRRGVKMAIIGRDLLSLHYITKEQVEKFLEDFSLKVKIFGIRFRDDRQKNQTCHLHQKWHIS